MRILRQKMHSGPGVDVYVYMELEDGKEAGDVAKIVCVEVLTPNEPIRGHVLGPMPSKVDLDI